MKNNTLYRLKNMGGKIIWLPVLLYLAGCALVGPDYKPATPAAPAAWQSPLKEGLETGTAANDRLGRWWQVFNDPVLTDLEKEAVRDNLDLKTAGERLRQARALLGVSRAGLYPALNANGAALKNRGSDNAGGTGEDELFSAGLDAAWELDIFGGQRRAVEAARGDLGAMREARRDVLVSLTAEVGMNYIGLRTFQARLAAARKNLATQKRAYELNKSRFQAGLIDELALQQSLYNYEHGRARIPQLETGLQAAQNRLAVLLGKRPGELTEKLNIAAPVPAAPAAITIGLPAEALRRRPDIRRAERQLAAQTARVGVATADLYPSFRLNGTIGLEALNLSDLPEWASRLFSVGPAVSWHVFDADKIRRNIEVQNSLVKQAALNYQNTVLQALEEEENSLTAYVKEKNRHQSLNRAVEAASRADRIARDRYRAGLTDFSNVLDAQRSLLDFNDELIQSSGAIATDLIRLYKALGGGWRQTKSREAVRE